MQLEVISQTIDIDILLLVTLNKNSSFGANSMAPLNIIHGNGVAALSRKYFLL